jgi:N-methylhydantoinase B/oxoprolinase/acetone carboxylase alpha subunit
MTRLEVILILVLALSLVANIGLVTYVRATLSRLLFVSDELGDLQDMINSFADHVSEVYNLEMFYGDQTLQGLMEHAISLSEQLETFEMIYSLTTKEETKEIDFEDAADPGEQPQED